MPEVATNNQSFICQTGRSLGMLMLMISLLQTTQLHAQSADMAESQANIIKTKGFTITLSKASQYMQSVQLIFEMHNQDSLFTNNCWFHVTLLTPAKAFLYREQPLLFNNVQAGSTQKQELLCESIGIEELGYIVLHPILYESADIESAFNYQNITLKVADNLPYHMVFSFQAE